MPPPPIDRKLNYVFAEGPGGRSDSGMSTSHEVHPPGETQALTVRLRKISGQLRAVEGMLAEDYNCADVLMQLVSARRGIKALAEKLIHSHMEHCIDGATSPAEARRKLRDLLSVLERYVD